MKWKAPVIYTAAGVLIGSTLMTATPAFAQLNFKPFQAKLVQNGQVVSKPSAIAYNGTSYFGIWWLEQQLKKDGISVQWDGKSFTITGMPVQSTDTLSAQGSSGNGSTLFSNTINVNGVTYVPLNEVQALLKSAGSQVQIQSSHEDQGDGQDTSLQGVVQQLKHISGKLTEYQNGQTHGDGGAEGEVYSNFAGSLMQLQTVINNLTQLSQSSTGTTTTSTNTTTNSTSSTGSTTSTGSTNSATTSTGSASSTIPTVQLSSIISSLQNDYTQLNAYALQAMAGASNTNTFGSGSTNSMGGASTNTATNTSTSTTTAPTDLNSVISDINTQVQALSALNAASTSTGTNGGLTSQSGQDN